MDPVYGRLSVDPTSGLILGANGQEVRLRGMSTHGVHWFPKYVNKDCFQSLRDEWKVNVIRIAMYVEEGGYTQDGEVGGQSYKKVCEAVDACIDLGLYAIVDWHVSNADQTPMKHASDASIFFTFMAERYKDSPNVLYEVCNEPNNAGNDYASQIQPYVAKVMRVIRQAAPSAIVIIGSGDWSKHPYEAWQYDKTHQCLWPNVLYTLHRYCDGDFSSGWWNGQNNGWSPSIRAARKEGCPIIATECGVSNSSEWDWNTAGQFKTIIDFYEEVGISWQVWALADKSEPSSVLAPNAPGSGHWTDAQISAAGHVVRDALWNAAKASKPLPVQPAPVLVPPTPAPAGKPSAQGPASISFTSKGTFKLSIKDDVLTFEGQVSDLVVSQ